MALTDARYGNNTKEPLNKSVTWVFIPPVVPAKAGTSVHSVLGSCFRRNDGVKALAFNDLFRISLNSVTDLYGTTRNASCPPVAG